MAGLTPATLKVGRDFWATGEFVEANGSFIHGANSAALPSDLQMVDFGDFYASKTFYEDGALDFNYSEETKHVGPDRCKQWTSDRYNFVLGLRKNAP